MTTTAVQHPAWCDAHDAFDDGSADWHKSSDVEVPGLDEDVYLTTGTLSREVGILFVGGWMPGQGLTLEQAEGLAAALLELVKRARA